MQGNKLVKGAPSGGVGPYRLPWSGEGAVEGLRGQDQIRASADSLTRIAPYPMMS